VALPLEVEDLGRRFGEYRGRAIHFAPFAIPVPGPYALTWVEPDCEVILYQLHAPAPAQRHYKAHELGHLIAGHTPEEVTAGHSEYRARGSAIEREAEAIASIILEWALVFDDLPGITLGLTVDPVSRVESAVTLHRRGWL
jgi:Zn-dependent peptidase ImmA (M78 family)